MNLEVTWTELKEFIDDRNLSVQWININSRYQLVALDGAFSVNCNILQTSPRSNDQADFEDNYQAAGNKLLAFSASDILIDRSGSTSATPNTSTQIIPINIDRKYLFIQNVDTSVIWINFTVNATTSQPSISLIPGSSFVMEGTAITTEAINIISSVASVEYTAKEK